MSLVKMVYYQSNLRDDSKESKDGEAKSYTKVSLKDTSKNLLQSLMTLKSKGVRVKRWYVKSIFGKNSDEAKKLKTIEIK